MAGENVFTFDTNPFMRGLTKVAQGIGGLQKNIGNMAKNVSSGVTSAIAKIGLLTLAFRGVKAAISEMPEIGQTFKIAKNIIMKNLLFPLRKAVFPLLQKFLNWVRDNRAMFVKWGQVLVNIFESVVNAVKGVIDWGLKLANGFKDFISQTFGLQIKTFQDFINVMSFKIAVVIEFLKSLIGEVIKFLTEVDQKGTGIQDVLNSVLGLFSDIFNFVFKITKSFVEGFAPTVKNILTPIKKIVDAFKDIFDSLFGGEEQLKVWETIFKTIGDVIGTVIVFAFEKIADFMNLISEHTKIFVEGIKWIVENIGKITGGIGTFFQDVGTGITKTAGGIFDFLNPFDDVIVTKEGKVVPVNSNDNIMAFKKDGPIERNMEKSEVIEKKINIIPVTEKNESNIRPITVNVDFRGMQLLIQNAAPEEAQRFGETLVDQLRNTLSLELERLGSK